MIAPANALGSTFLDDDVASSDEEGDVGDEDDEDVVDADDADVTHEVFPLAATKKGSDWACSVTACKESKATTEYVPSMTSTGSHTTDPAFDGKSVVSVADELTLSSASKSTVSLEFTTRMVKGTMVFPS